MVVNSSGLSTRSTGTSGSTRAQALFVTQAQDLTRDIQPAAAQILDYLDTPVPGR